MNESEQKNVNAAANKGTPKPAAGPDTAASAGPTQTQVEELPAQVALTAEQLEAIKERASKADEYWDRLLRQGADFENFKKRAARERQEAVKFANEGLLAKLIPILDTFEMALAAANTAKASTANAEPATAQSLQAGVAMIQSQLKNVLAEAGLEEIDAAGKPFDPNFHEAVAQKETTEMPEGHVAVQLRKGYKFRDRLIRAATVVVAKKPAA